LILIQKIQKKVNKNLIDILKDIFIPPLCVACGKIDAGLLCEECISKIKEIEYLVCDRCGRPLLENKTNDTKNAKKRCNFCKSEDFNFYKHRSFAIYSGEIKKVIKKYKYNKIYDLKEIISIFLLHAYIKYYKNEKIDYLETVPGMHMSMICESLSGLIKIPFAGNIFRIKKIAKQQGLDFTQRRNNIKGAFKVKNCLLYYGKNVLVVDDVWTTGSTMMEIAGVLKKAGANKIYLLTLTRGIQ